MADDWVKERKKEEEWKLYFVSDVIYRLKKKENTLRMTIRYTVCVLTAYDYYIYTVCKLRMIFTYTVCKLRVIVTYRVCKLRKIVIYTV